MTWLAVLSKGLIGGVLLFCAAIWIGQLPTAVEAKLYLQGATIVLAIPLLVSWIYNFR